MYFSITLYRISTQGSGLGNTAPPHDLTRSTKTVQLHSYGVRVGSWEGCGHSPELNVCGKVWFYLYEIFFNEGILKGLTSNTTWASCVFNHSSSNLCFHAYNKNFHGVIFLQKSSNLFFICNVAFKCC